VVWIPRILWVHLPLEGASRSMVKLANGFYMSAPNPAGTESAVPRITQGPVHYGCIVLPVDRGLEAKESMPGFP
jgi:hypothetical protein